MPGANEATEIAQRIERKHSVSKCLEHVPILAPLDGFVTGAVCTVPTWGNKRTALDAFVVKHARTTANMLGSIAIMLTTLEM
uniref:Uncharacterized protein n=1 Tax=Strigamia maritima TaxID=126957 RepID=T1JN64_STRMM